MLSADGRVVDVPRRVVSCPPALYPMTMQATGYDGVVTLDFVIDTTGRADTASIRLVAADHPAFVTSARSALRRCRFVPGRLAGRPIATRNRMTFTFTVM